MQRITWLWALSLMLGAACRSTRTRADDAALELAGVTVTPHFIAEAMRYAKPPDPELGARVQLFVRNRGAAPLRLSRETSIQLRGKSPDDWLASKRWTWHDFPSAWPDAPLDLPPGAITVWTFNGAGNDWGAGTSAELQVDLGDGSQLTRGFEISAPKAWISALTFLAADQAAVPDTLVAHVANEHDHALEIIGCRVWRPASNATWRALELGARQTGEIGRFPADRKIPPHDKGIVRAQVGPLPLSYAAVEIETRDAKGKTQSLWGHVRVKREAFDISGGWVGGVPGSMTFEPFLKTLRRMHVNTAHMADQFPGYTDQTAPGGLYARYPLKYFAGLQPPEKYQSLEMLPRIHAVEFLGEPQYGGGRPVPPREVWEKLAPYQATKLPTTVTHSEERIWRYYAGLSDYPHYDAYRVCAPSPDAWQKYDRWGGVKILWGSPLETIGDMCRSLRELNRPAPTAIWSQGPHEGWGPMWGRRRASPTPDELRVQAYHALASRITSLYWFNLSLRSLVKYRDTLDELTRVGREMRLLDEPYLSGDAYEYRRLQRGDRLDWDLASIVAPEAALLFALDLDYAPDQQTRVFHFGEPRPATFAFRLPTWLREPADVFRLDADGAHEVVHQRTDQGLEISDTLNKVGVYLVAARGGLRARLEAKRQALVEYERSFNFDPARNDADFAVLEEFVRQAPGKQK